jgi:hypothetical protein
MAVVINEFEIVPEAMSPPGEAALPAPPTPMKAGGPTPEDVRHIVRSREERAQRLFAH